MQTHISIICNILKKQSFLCQNKSESEAKKVPRIFWTFLEASFGEQCCEQPFPNHPVCWRNPDVLDWRFLFGRFGMGLEILHLQQACRCPDGALSPCVWGHLCCIGSRYKLQDAPSTPLSLPYFLLPFKSWVLRLTFTKGELSSGWDLPSGSPLRSAGPPSAGRSTLTVRSVSGVRWLRQTILFIVNQETKCGGALYKQGWVTRGVGAEETQ